MPAAPSRPNSATIWLIPTRMGFTACRPWLRAPWMAAFTSARSQTLSVKDGLVKSNGADVWMYAWKAPLKTAASPVKKKPSLLKSSVAVPSANVYDVDAIFTPPDMKSDCSVAVRLRWKDESFISSGPSVKPLSSPFALMPESSMVAPIEARHPLALWAMQLVDGELGSALKLRQPVPSTDGGSGVGRLLPT